MTVLLMVGVSLLAIGLFTIALLIACSGDFNRTDDT